MCLAQGHKAVTPVRLEPAALGSRVKHSTPEPPRSLDSVVPRSRFLGDTGVPISKFQGGISKSGDTLNLYNF